MSRPWNLWVAGILVSLLAAVYSLAARSVPFCQRADEAVFILIGRALRSGQAPTSVDPLPGYPLLLAFPDWLLSPHWGWYWILGVIPSLLTVTLIWRLYSRLLPPKTALAAFLLSAFHPLMTSFAGAVLPDILYTGLAILVFLLADRSARTKNAPVALLALAGALAALVRPEGAWLVLCAGMVLCLGNRIKEALLFGVFSLAPDALWLLRDMRLHHQLTGYASHWRAQASAAAGTQWHIAAAWLADILGQTFWDIPALWPRALRLLLGIAALLACIRGARVLLASSRDPHSRRLCFGIAAYLIGLFCLHLTWTAIAPRYFLHFLPFLWLFVVAGLDFPTLRLRNPALILGGIIFISFLASDLRLARPGLSSPRGAALPKTISWIDNNTPPTAVFQSLVWPTLRLLANRTAYPSGTVPLRDYWMSAILSRGISYIHVIDIIPDGFFTPEMAETVRSERHWAQSSPYIKKVFASLSERSMIFKVSHPDPRRYLSAMNLLQRAVDRLAKGQNVEQVRHELIESAKIEPSLSAPWQMLAGIERNPQKRLAYLEKAAAAEPESRPIRAAMESARHALVIEGAHTRHGRAFRDPL